MRHTAHFILLLSATAFTVIASVRDVKAGCAPAPTGGTDVIVCDATTAPNPSGPLDFNGGNDKVTVNSGGYGNFAFPSGNNTLIFGLGGGSPALTGTVLFGGGEDRMEVHSGTITGNIDQAGGVDTFIMTGGQVIGNLEQSGDRDIFFMSGGTITGAFIEGDVITITGGSIGSVNMNIGNNIFDMSGGTVVGDVIGFGNDDTFILSGGFIGANVDLGNGDNSFAVTGGQIVGNVSAGPGTALTPGTDTFTWDGGGTIGGAISLGAGDDTATLRSLTSANLTMSLLDGGAGIDTLTFDNTEATGIGRAQNWETVSLTNGTLLTLDTNLVLGDGGSAAPITAPTLTGALSIDASSTLFAGAGVNPSILPFSAGQSVTVTNAGTIDLTNGPASATDSITVVGNYIGAGGSLNLQTVLGADGSQSDRFVVSGAGNTASGSTAMAITNLGGGGAQTVADGILVVQTTDDATTQSGSFSLAGPVAAGAYEYVLFRGGVTGGTADNWYLRSTLPPTPQASPPPQAAPGSPSLPSPPPPGAAPVPLFRPEVAVHSAVLETARTLGLTTLGTFHERQGDQMLLLGDRASAVWARVFGQKTEESLSRGVRASFDGVVGGLQAGGDVARLRTLPGHKDHLGLYVAQAEARGDVRGFVIGIEDASAGRMDLAATSFGGYWTHIGPTGWYLDGVLQGSLLDGSPHSDRGVSADISGGAFAASLEGGYPIPLSPLLTLEPQAQAIWQQLWLDDTRDRFSAIAFDQSDAFTGRIGVRLRARVPSGGGFWQPYLKANLWWNAGGADVVTFAGDAIAARRSTGAAGEIGAGVTARLSPSVSLYADAGYLEDFGGDELQTIKGNLGLRITW